jgi:hypothetical protein
MVIAAVITGLGACEKKADNTTAWVGTYNGNGTDSINKVVVSKVNNNTLAIQLVAHTDSAVYTFGMLQNVTVQSPTAIAINENDSLYPFGGDYYNITGNGTLNGNTLTLNDTAKNTVSANPRIIFSFTGSK